MSKETIKQCEFSIYSKSLVNLYFYVGDSGGTVKSAVIKMLEDHANSVQIFLARSHKVFVPSLADNW